MRSRQASASSSSAGSIQGSPRAAGALIGALAAGVVASLVLAAGAAQAKVFHARQDALKLAFPDAERIEKRTFILKPDQIAAIRTAARAKTDSRLVTIFTAWKQGAVLGHAHIDVHTVRTHPSALLVVWTPEGEVRSVRILAFHEPLDYLPAEKWYLQFEGATLEDKLRVGGDVHGVVNATLSTRVASDSVRRALAYHALLIAPEAAAPDSPQQEP